MDELDAILDEVEVYPAESASHDLDSLLDDALNEVISPQLPVATAKPASTDVDVDNMDLKIVTDLDRCIGVLGDRGEVWRRWMAEETPRQTVSILWHKEMVKIPNRTRCIRVMTTLQAHSLGPSRAYRSFYGGKESQDFQTSTRPQMLLKGEQFCVGETLGVCRAYDASLERKQPQLLEQLQGLAFPTKKRPH